MELYRVEEIEYERGWGSRLEEIYYFGTEEIAKKFCDAYDEKYNTADSTPDWYMKQNYSGKVAPNSVEIARKHWYKGDLVDNGEFPYESN